MDGGIEEEMRDGWIEEERGWRYGRIVGWWDRGGKER